MTIENVYTIHSSFIVWDKDKSMRSVEQLDNVKANSEEKAVAWVKEFHNKVWEKDLLNWNYCFARPIFISDITSLE